MAGSIRHSRYRVWNAPRRFVPGIARWPGSTPVTPHMIRTGPLRHHPYLFLLSVIFLSACGETPVDPTTTPESVSVSATPNPVDLPGTAQVTAVIQPADAPQGVSWASSDTDVATVDANGVVTTLLTGSVTITATSTADPIVSGSVVLGIECPEPRIVTSAPTADTTWENWIPDPICFDYIVQDDIDLNDETLTIEAGTVVGFEADLRVRIRGTAGLVADGLEDEPIILRGVEAERGFWEGIEIDAEAFDEHVLSHTWIEHTSGEVPLSGSEPAGLKLGGSITVRLEHSVMRASEGYGMFMAQNVEVTGEGANTWTDNALGPVYTFASEVDDLLVNESVLTGNDVAPVRVYPNVIAHEASWPYGLFEIEDPPGQNFDVTGSLSLGPGVEIRFGGAGEGLRVAQSGFLSAVGTASEPVLLTGTESVPGHWGGVQFDGSNSASNRLDFVVVEYGGGTDGKTERGNVMLETDGGSSTRVSIQNTVMRHSVDYGIFAEVGTVLDAFSGNTMTDNALGAALIDAPVVASFGSGNSYLGNGREEVTVRAGTGRSLEVGTTWEDIGVPYFLEQFNSPTWFVIDAAFTVQPGVRMRFSPGLRLALIQNAFIAAEGTQLNPIVFEAMTTAWGGISFLDSNGSFDFVTISDGGDNPDMTNIEINTVSAAAPPGSTVTFSSEVTLTGATNNIVFGPGETIAVGCIGPIVIPAGDEVSDHCRPPGG